MYLFAHNCSHIQSSGDKNSPSGRTEVSISLVHHNYPSPKSIVQKVLYKVRILAKCDTKLLLADFLTKPLDRVQY